MSITLNNLYKTTKTILTNRDLALIWNETNYDRLKSKISYYVKNDILIRLTRRIYAKDKQYNKKELATSIYTPSYLSFETVLREEGVIFQYSDTLTVATKWPKTLGIGKNVIRFRKLKESVLYNTSGIIFKDNYNTATLERAFLDTIYLFPNYYFDSLSNINWKKCFEMVEIYDNKQLVKRLNKYYKNYAKQD